MLTRLERNAMCRQCANGNYDQCLGVVYVYAIQEFRSCETQGVEHATV